MRATSNGGRGLAAINSDTKPTAASALPPVRRISHTRQTAPPLCPENAFSRPARRPPRRRETGRRRRRHKVPTQVHITAHLQESLHLQEIPSRLATVPRVHRRVPFDGGGERGNRSGLPGRGANRRAVVGVALVREPVS